MSISEKNDCLVNYKFALLSAPGLVWLALSVALSVGLYIRCCVGAAETVRRASMVKCLTNMKHEAFVLSLALEKSMRERTYIADMYQEFSVFRHKNLTLVGLVHPLDKTETSALADVQKITNNIKLATEDFGNAASKNPIDANGEDRALESYGDGLKNFLIVCDKLHEYERNKVPPADDTVFGIVAGVILLFALGLIVRKDLQMWAALKSELSDRQNDLQLAEQLVAYQADLSRNRYSVPANQTNLGDSFRSCAQSISLELAEGGARITVEDTSLVAKANREVVDSIVSRLLRMSFQSSSKDIPTIVKARETENSMVAISVRCFGEGMDTEVAESVFQPWRLPAHHRARSAYGLVAAETRALAQSSGGDMSILSQPGSGTEFIVLLPRA